MKPLFFLIAFVSLEGCQQHIPPVGGSLRPADQLAQQFSRAMQTAVAYWNAAGLRLDPPAPDAPVAVTLEIDSHSVEHLGFCYVNEAPPRIVLSSQAIGGATEGEKAGLLAHELGHALGLDHVSDQTSVMNPTVLVPIARDAVPVDLDRRLAASLMVGH